VLFVGERDLVAVDSYSAFKRELRLRLQFHGAWPSQELGCWLDVPNLCTRTDHDYYSAAFYHISQQTNQSRL